MSRILRLPSIIQAPAIWPKGRTGELFAAMPPMRVQGFVTVELIHAATGIVKRRLEFPNLVTNAGLDYIGTNRMELATRYSYIQVGTGSTAPAVGQVALVTPLTPRTNATGGITDVVGSGASFAYWYRRFSREFTQAEVNGNLTEFGLFTASSGGTMWARQLFKDAGGTPTTIVKTSADFLRIIYELRIYPPTVDASGNTTISGTSYAWVSRAAEIDGQWQGLLDVWFPSYAPESTYWQGFAYETDVLAATTGTPAGTGTTTTSSLFSAYTNGNYYRDVEFTWGTTLANYATGVGAIATAGNGVGGARFQTSFAPKFAKDNTKQLKVTLRYPWTRY